MRRPVGAQEVSPRMILVPLTFVFLACSFSPSHCYVGTYRGRFCIRVVTSFLSLKFPR